MKIALLAPSGAGKTSYLTGLYGVLTQHLNDTDYGINFTITDRVKDSYLDERFTNLLEKGDFGEPSKQLAVYPAKLTARKNHTSKRELNIEIVDFPGEVLHRAREENLLQVEEIIQRLSECDGFIVLLDGEALLKNADRPEILRNRLKANAVRAILNDALERRRIRLENELVDPNAYAFSSGPTPIAFALTKGDIVENWLSKPPEKKGETINDVFNKIRHYFRPHIEYKQREGEIAMLIRSEFNEIIEANDVISARTNICVYDERRQNFKPMNLEYLFQFVIFTGLRNAAAEYNARLKNWNSDFNKKDQVFNNQKKYYNEAIEDKNKNYTKKNALVRWALDVFNEEKGSTGYDLKINSRYSTMTEAGKKRDQSILAVKQVQENQADAMLFAERILSDKLVYLLSHGATPKGFYQQGLPLELLLKEFWWTEKLEKGKNIVRREKRDDYSPDVK